MTTRDPRTCATCYGPIESEHRGDECQACAEWLAYWASRTPAEQETESAMMDAYVSDHEGEPG